MESLTLPGDTDMNFVNFSVGHGLISCLGHFCGRVDNLTQCGACPWGSRSYDNDSGSICTKCSTTPALHEWLYLGFIALFPMFPFFYDLPSHSLDLVIPSCKPSGELPGGPVQSVQRRTKDQLKRSFCTVMRLSAATVFPLVHAVAAICSLLLFQPYGRLQIYVCIPQRLDEFYAPLLAASGCTSEVVYPLTSLPLTYYALSALGCILFYFVILVTDATFLKRRYVPVIHTLLYAYPILCLGILILGGVLYFTFAYVLLAAAILHSVYRFPILFDYCTGGIVPICHPLTLFKALFVNPKPCYACTIVMSVFCYSYALLAQNQPVLWSVMLSVVPFLFYALTLPFTHPFVALDGGKAMQLASTYQSFGSPAWQMLPISERTVVNQNRNVQPDVKPD